MDRQRLVNLLRDAQRKAAQYYAADPEGLYDDITEALAIVEPPPVAETTEIESSRIIGVMRGTRRILPNRDWYRRDFKY